MEPQGSIIAAKNMESVADFCRCDRLEAVKSKASGHTDDEAYVLPE